MQTGIVVVAAQLRADLFVYCLLPLVPGFRWYAPYLGIDLGPPMLIVVGLDIDVRDTLLPL